VSQATGLSTEWTRTRWAGHDGEWERGLGHCNGRSRTLTQLIAHPSA